MGGGGRPRLGAKRSADQLIGNEQAETYEGAEGGPAGGEDASGVR